MKNFREFLETLEEILKNDEITPPEEELSEEVEVLGVTPSWINAEERLPEKGERVLVVEVLYGAPSDVHIATRDYSGWDFGYYYQSDSNDSTIYWMPIPEFKLN